MKTDKHFEIDEKQSDLIENIRNEIKLKDIENILDISLI
jgi:hypothetical protein